jgi:hypothetical protein
VSAGQQASARDDPRQRPARASIGRSGSPSGLACAPTDAHLTKRPGRTPQRLRVRPLLRSPREPKVRQTGHTSWRVRTADRLRPRLDRRPGSHRPTRRLQALGVDAERIYVDHGLTGTRRDRPGLREALAACRAGDTLVVTKLDRLARSLPDARDIADDLTRRTVRRNLGGSVYDPLPPEARRPSRRTAVLHPQRADARAPMVERRRPHRPARHRGRRRGSASLCAAPAPPRARRRAGSRGGTTDRDSAPTRPQQPRHHQRPPARHRQRRDHRHRPRPPRTDHPGQRLASAGINRRARRCSSREAAAGSLSSRSPNGSQNGSAVSEVIARFASPRRAQPRRSTPGHRGTRARPTRPGCPLPRTCRETARRAGAPSGRSAEAPPSQRRPCRRRRRFRRSPRARRPRAERQSPARHADRLRSRRRRTSPASDPSRR